MSPLAEAPSSGSIKNRLFFMMILEIAIWGAWQIKIFPYMGMLGFTAGQQAWVGSVFGIASLIGMFFSNQFADRTFAAEKFLAVSHLIGGVAILALGYVKAFPVFLALMFVHGLFYVPTISITNSIAFANIRDPQKEFGPIRMGGTIGWILAAWPFTFILVDWAKVHAANPQGLVQWLGAVLGSGLTGDELKHATRFTYIVAGIASLALAGFSLMLPHTPPKKKSEGAGESLAWLEAARLLKHPFILVLWLVTFADAFVHNCYFNWTGVFLGTAVEKGGVGIPGNWIMPVMSVGQIAEILTMLILGVTLKKLGWRTTMIVGILGHAARFAVYALLPEHQGLIVLVQILHGICYAFFFATVYIFVDAYFPADIRSSAQGLFNVMILGIGALVANSICPWMMQALFTSKPTPEAAEAIVNFRGLFLVPCAIASLAAVVLALFFHPPKTNGTGSGGSAPAH